jgi:hypothetical protein
MAAFYLGLRMAEKLLLRMQYELEQMGVAIPYD